MQRKFSILMLSYIVITTAFICTSCEKLHSVIGYAKNNTKDTLVGANLYKYMTDSILCNERVNIDTYILPNESSILESRPVTFNNEPDSSKEYIYIFNSDSLNKYQKQHLCYGIVKNCLVKRIEIQLNKVKDPLDTIFINSSKPSN